ncbi:unnamed protein product [Allacma fusca]|uniref:Uncharacterized protein n=1 Tax=Allacma fusca TaxID=39272 RepID=A0A8J2Q395_9HEXA|nr:unnamed protein product [Allacma fusca]
MEFSSFVNATPKYQTVLDEIGGANWKLPLRDGTAVVSLPLILVDDPFLDQSVPTKMFLRSERYVCGRVILAVWLLLLIVLGTGYKTKLLEMVVLPYYIHPPTTFSELARSSYKIGILSYPKLRSDLNQSNSTITKSIQRRHQEYAITAPDCYQQIFEENMACMGSTFSIDFFGITYMTDVRKQMLSQESKDTLFHELLTVGISKWHSYLIGESHIAEKAGNYDGLNIVLIFLEPFNFVSSGMESGGIFKTYWNPKLKQQNMAKGQQYAQQHVHVLKYYNGKSHKERFKRQIIHLSYKLLIYGVMLSLLVHLLELGLFYTRSIYDSIIHLPCFNYSYFVLIIKSGSKWFKNNG